MLIRYVAMHSMQGDGGHEHSVPNGLTDGRPAMRTKIRHEMTDTFAAVLGMLVPLLTQFKHHH